MKGLSIPQRVRSSMGTRRALLALVLGLTWAGSAVVLGANDAKNASSPPPKSDTVHISLQTVPPRKASVRWGKKELGPVPAPRALSIERPRDSGPLDLVLRASGYLPVHTRVYTFSDSHVSVKLTPPTEKNTLFGYRQEIAPNPDGGAPEPAKAEPPKADAALPPR